MLSRSREAVAPLYLLACLILGGSAQGIWQNMLLQLAGIAIIAWAAAARAGEPPLPTARHLLLLALAGLAVVVIQLVPLPASVWSHLAGREPIAEGYRLLGMNPPPLPLSLAPYNSLSTLLAVIPALAIFCCIVRFKATRASWLAAALFAGVIAGVLLGAVQVASGNATQSVWYLYDETNVGVAVGFFANANHMAILLVVALPFLAAFVAAGRTSNIQRYSALLALVAGAALVVLVGIALNNSLAAYGLALPVLAASAMIVLPSGSRLRLWALILAAVLMIGAVTALSTASIGSGNLGAATSVESRAEILATSMRALKDFLPWGSGLGSFQNVYHLYENPAQITTTYVIHAHNDYVELALETGVLGIVVILAFLWWWAAAVWRVWRTAEAGPFARAATIASAAILAHSLVDFPLRTAAVSACFAMCLALIAGRRAPQPVDSTDLRPARHIEFR